MQRFGIGVLALAATLGAAACGDDEKGSGGAGGTEAYCAQVTAFKTDSDAVDVVFDSATPDPAALKAAMEKLRPQIDSLVANAPAEIKADLTLVTTTQQQLIDVFAKYDFDLMAISTSPEFAELQTMNTDEMQAASDRLDAWAKTTCGIDFNA